MQKNSWVPFWECVSASHQGRADCSRSMIIPVGLTQHGCYPFFVITTNNQALDFNWSVKIFPFGFQPVWYRMMWSFKQTNDMLLEILSGVIKWMKMHSLFSCLCLPSFTLLSFQASDSSFLSFSLSLQFQSTKALLESSGREWTRHWPTGGLAARKAPAEAHSFSCTREKWMLLQPPPRVMSWVGVYSLSFQFLQKVHRYPLGMYQDHKLVNSWEESKGTF